MANASDLLKLIKGTAVDAVNATQPTGILFGTVTGAAPLEISIEQNLVLGVAQLVLTRNVTEFTTEVTVDWETEKGGDEQHNHNATVTVQSGGDPSHTHGATCKVLEKDISHQHKIQGRKEITMHNDLQIGEEVILIRMQGGQKFLVVDRVVSL